MQTQSVKAGELLDLAERHIRTVGYNGFSFRTLADEAGIKSASVHYHFPTKEHLAAAVAMRYADRFFAELGDPAAVKTTPADQMKTFIELFRGALRDDGRMCLFCMLGAEFSTLPPDVQAAVRQFFLRSTEWLAKLFAHAPDELGHAAQDPAARARTIIAALEGAMIVARCSNDLAIFDDIAGQMAVHGLIPAQRPAAKRRLPAKK